jgi:polyvinyl alcohol dehydrogenase (cytochrome)
MRIFFGSWIPVGLFSVAVAFAQPPVQTVRSLGAGAGAKLFGDRCEICHGNPDVERAPSPAVLKQFSPEKIHEALTTGAMKTQAANLTDDEKIYIAEWVGGRRIGVAESGDIKNMTNRCATNPPSEDISKTPSWNGWSADPTNNRFQTAKAADLSPGQVSRLTLKWAFGLPGAVSSDSQPTVVDGRVFLSSDTGWVYSLNAETGCVYWSFQAQAAIRSAPIVSAVKTGSSKNAVFFGDIHGHAYGVDANSGELLWRITADDHPLTRITGGIQVHNGKVFIPVASMEEPESSSPNYKCCTMRGVVTAVNAETGSQIWKAYTIEEKPTLRETPQGVPYMGPSGADVWDSPTIDAKRNVLYIGTGNNFSDPSTDTSDAVMAINLDTGKIVWTVQLLAGDVWHSGCPGNVVASPPGTIPVVRPQAPRPKDYYCPGQHPDYDISASPMLATLADGRNLLIVGAKSGIVTAHDVDHQGAIVWKNDVARKVPPSGTGEILFGGSTDGRNAYFNLKSGGIVALRLTDGTEEWYNALPPQESMKTHPGLSAAVSSIPGAVFSPALDGMLRAFASSTGKLLWEYNTAQEFKTVNGIQARGGSIGSAGAVIVNGAVFVASGYTEYQGGTPGNVLLCFMPYDRIPQ